MSLECSECEHDLRVGHLDSCSRHPNNAAMRQNEFLLRVLTAFEASAGGSELWWRTDGKYAPITFLVNCNDFFWWGTGDCVELTPDNINVLEKAMEDCRVAADPVGEVFGGLLFCARVRGMRPQGAYYASIEKDLWLLFDAAGPEREVDMMNPGSHP